MRVLYLTTGCFDKGGISRYSRYQISALRQTFGSDNVRVLSLLGPDEHSFEEPIEVHWHGRGARTTALGKLSFASQAFKLAACWRPHIIHSAHVNLSPLAYSLASLCRAKTYLNAYGLEIWSGLSAVRSGAFARMDQIVADCHHTAQYITTSAMHAGRPAVIWDCVDLDRFSPRQAPVSVLEKYGIPSKDENFVILSLGRLSKSAAHKGFDRLIQVFASLGDNPMPARLVIAGRGDNQASLKGLAADLGVSNRVDFIGSIDEADLPDVYRAASVFSLISDRGLLRGEGLPLVVLEAMACGIPILVGNHDGSQEAVVDGRNGFVVDPHDFEVQSEVLCRLWHNPTLLADMQSEARSVAVERFGYQRFRAEHEALYDITRHSPDHALGFSPSPAD